MPFVQRFYRLFGVLGDVIAVALAALAIGESSLPWGWNSCVPLIAGVGLVVFVVFRVLAEIGCSQRDEAAEQALKDARADVRSNSKANEQYYREILSRVPLQDIERRALALATRLSTEIIDGFLADQFAVDMKYHKLEALRDHPKALHELSYTRNQVDEEWHRVEIATTSKYRDGNFAQEIAAVVADFAATGVHESFTNIDLPGRAPEPYRIISFRDALYRLVAKSSGAN